MKKRSLLLLASVVMLTACSTTTKPAPEQSGLTFVHLNDTYRVGDVEDGTAGGFSRALSIVRELQSSGREVRILHGGDFLYPSLESQLWNGQQMIDALNTMDAVAPLYLVAGNHEFDRRQAKHLVAAVNASTFDWLGDNYSFATGNATADSALQSAFTFRHAGKTIGIFALTLHADDGGNTRAYAAIDKAYVAIAENTIEALESAGVDAIIGLTHLHMWQDRDVAQLRAKHPKFVFIAGGHEHEPEYEPISDHSAAIIKGASNARVIWTVDLVFDANGVPGIQQKKVVLDESVPLDAEYQVIEDKWRARLLQKFPFLEAKVGVAALPLDAREVTIRNGESGWGNFIVDQMRGAFGEVADFAFINSGTLRIDDWIDGDILFEDIGRTFGFSSFVRQVTMTGAEFKQLLEAGYRGFGPSKGYFPQVSGFRVCVDRSRNEFERIASLQVDDGDAWQEIDANKDYSVVVSDYLFGGGDGYEIPGKLSATPPASELKYLVLDAVLRAQGLGEKTGQPITQENRRYHQLLEGKEPCFR
jgi:5'-nucleotidase